ncbi:IS1634 family transposase [bacterium]|nr:IS1634 family transposase [bacterium]
MSTKTAVLTVQDLDHCGIVAGIIDQMGLVEQINRVLGVHPQQKVSAGVVVKAMIINGLGFVSAPLYLFEQFFVGKATEHLLGEGVKPEHLNDDRLGRVLDQLYQTGVTSLFVQLALVAAARLGVKQEWMHLDSSSFHVHGEYLSKEGTVTEELGAIRITHGYSREHRPDLKQFIVDLMCSGDGEVPLYLRVGSGNESDQATFVERIKEFREQWQSDAVFVADTALYSSTNIQAMTEMQWLTRAPATIKEAQELMETIAEEGFEAAETPGYRYSSVCSMYGGVKQRWLVVESEARRKSDLKQLDKKVQQQLEATQKKLKKLSKKTFACAPDAEAAARQFNQELRYHCLEQIKVIAQANSAKARRAPLEEISQSGHYCLEGTLVVNPEVIEQETRKAGRFILATNILDSQFLCEQGMLDQYKEQQGAERGFRFLKEPLFFTSSVFLKTPERIEALAMVMGLSLLVYTLAQRTLRQALATSQQTVKNQLGKPSATPTMRWVFQCFQSIHLVIINGNRQIVNLTAVHQDILGFLGAPCQKYYLLV